MQKISAEKEAEDFLEKEKFPVARRAIIKKEEDIQAIEKIIPYPWVMKASSTKLLHKAKLGGVILSIDSQIKAQESFDKLSKLENFEEALVQEMVSGEEIIMGLKKTPEFGIVLMFGKGGSRVEEEKDVSFRVLPASKQEIKEMLTETKIYRVLEEKQANIKEMIKVIEKVANLAKKYPNILEFDINPLFVNKETAVIADTRIVFEN